MGHDTPNNPRHLPVLTTPRPAPSPTTQSCTFQVGWEQGSRGPHPLSPQLWTPPKSHSGDFSPSPDPCTHTHLGLPSPAEQPQPWDTHPDPALHSQPPQKAQSLLPSPPARQASPSSAFPSSAPQAALQAPGQSLCQNPVENPHLPTQVLAPRTLAPSGHSRPGPPPPLQPTSRRMRLRKATPTCQPLPGPASSESPRCPMRVLASLPLLTDPSVSPLPNRTTACSRPGLGGPSSWPRGTQQSGYTHAPTAWVAGCARFPPRWKGTRPKGQPQHSQQPPGRQACRRPRGWTAAREIGAVCRPGRPPQAAWGGPFTRRET